VRPGAALTSKRAPGPPSRLLARAPSDGLLIDLQRTAGNAAVTALLAARPVTAQRFESGEHRDIGTEASGGATLELDLGGGDKLTYGQMVALAGDYFASVQQMRDLAGTPDGQAELRWTRWWALGGGAEPALDEAVKTKVKNRYYTLATRNIAHFSAGGTARTEYETLHQQALAAAYLAGATGDGGRYAEATQDEAFGNHYLTDMFSAGHVRTPRQLIKEWYDQHFRGSVAQFVTYAAHWITDDLDATRQEVPWWLPDSWVEGDVHDKIITLGGPAVEGMSLGDIVSLALHDRDNAGLNVVSEVDPAGTEVSGGFHWRAVGDRHLAESDITFEMAVAGVRASLAELPLARELGQRDGGGQSLSAEALEDGQRRAIESLQPFKAERYIPREDTESSNIPVVNTPDAPSGTGAIDWRWGQMDPVARQAVDACVKARIAGTLRDKAGLVPETKTAGGKTMHVRAAFLDFCAHLESQGIAAVEAAIQTPAQAPAPLPDPITPSDAGVDVGDATVPQAPDATVPAPAY
jgi:hypothetical protein